jgi:proteasome activator subunit 4
LLESICGLYDGVRRRALPVLYKALEPGSDDDRMKGALWTLSRNSFGKYAAAEPTLATELFKHLFECQHNEKPSIQDCVSAVSENCLNNFAEPCFLVFDIENPSVTKALEKLKSCLQITQAEEDIVSRCRKKRIERISVINEAINSTTSVILDVGNSPRTHWRYAIVAVRCLRTLVRRDVPPTAPHICYFFEKSYDDHPSVVRT